MIQKIKDNIWQLCLGSFRSCIYLIKLKENSIIIDTGFPSDKDELIKDLNELSINFSEINTVLLTHKHPDHTGNIKIFKNAKIYGSKEDFSDENILDVDSLKINEFELIKTPGHTKGGVCFYMPNKKILFSGDTIFHNEGIGRMDLPGGSKEDMITSLQKLKNIDYDILCPGHI